MGNMHVFSGETQNLLDMHSDNGGEKNLKSLVKKNYKASNSIIFHS